MSKRKFFAKKLEKGSTSSKRKFSPQTIQVLELIKQGKHVEMIGQAGTGKTFTLKRAVEMMKRSHIPFVLTASTGRAAINIGGKTIHSFSGIGTGEDDAEVYLNKLRKSPWYRNAYKKPKVLVIEEISMLSTHQFDLVEKLARNMRNSNAPFGGLQVVVCGDYLQLPPVNGGFAFESQVYQRMFGAHNSTVVFTDIKRQTCPELIAILQEARVGKLSPLSIEKLKQCVDKPFPKDMVVEPMVLFAYRKNVHEFNMEKMDQIDAPLKIFVADWIPAPYVSAKENKLVRAMMENNIQAPKELVLKLHAQVMLVRNMSNLLPPKFNGSMGIVVGFDETKEGAPIVQFSDKSVVTLERVGWTAPQKKGEYVQYPLILGWALTIHKAQGATVDYGYIDLGESASKPNQAYTALSRVRTLAGVYLKEFDPKVFRPHTKALEYHTSVGEYASKETSVE